MIAASSPLPGDRPILHRIKRGESLSKIAKDYHFPTWKPIHVFNSRIHPILGSDPNLIPEGVDIWIPRSQAGYDRLIRKLQSLQDQARGNADQMSAKLDGQYYEHQADRVLFDLAGDVATLLGSVGVKAWKAAQSARVAAATTGRARVAAQYLADQDAQRLAQDLTGALKDKVVNAALAKADNDLGTAHKDLYLTQKKGIDAIRGVSLQKGKSLLDIADLVLDYVSVSNVADGLIALTYGETPGQSYQNAQETIRRSLQSSLMMLDQKIQRIRMEKVTVYA